MFDVFVEQGAPIHYQQSVRVVLRPRYSFELTCRHQLAHQYIASALDALPSVIGELHIALVEADAVAIDGKHGTRTQDVGVKTFLFEGIVLRQSCFVHQIHRFLHRVFDIFVIRRKSKEVVVDFLYILIQVVVHQLFCESLRNKSNKSDSF